MVLSREPLHPACHAERAAEKPTDKTHKLPRCLQRRLRASGEPGDLGFPERRADGIGQTGREIAVLQGLG